MNRLLPTTIFLLAIIALSPSFSDSVFAQTIIPHTITDPRIDGDVSKAHINFENTFGAAVSLNEILTGTTRADTGITISSLTFTPVPYSPQIQSQLDCNGDIYITTGTTSYSDTDLPISIIIDNPGTSNFATGDTLNLVVSINTSEYPKVATELFCQPGTPETPIAVYSITDGVGGFDELDGSNGITTVQIGSSIYALVASDIDDSVQIIDITNPATPTAVSSITDDGIFDELDGATGITTVKIGSSTYALVSSIIDDGIQIIDITNPATPTAVSSITDGGVDVNNNTFDELDRATGITTVQIGSSTYALVAARTDDGVQIINITNPATPTAVSSITDGGVDVNNNTFDKLDGIFAITTVQIGQSTYALTASTRDDGVQIINITNPATPTVASSVSDGSTFDELNGARGITTVHIGQSTYALVAAFEDDGVQIINITNPATPTAVSSITDGGNDDAGGIFELDGARDITTATIGSSTYALVASYYDDGVQIIDITNPATPTAVSSITDGGNDDAGGIFGELDGSYSITTVQIGSSTYALVTAIEDAGVQIIRISESQLEPVTPEPVTPEPVTPEPVTPEPVTPEPVTPEPVTPEPVTPEPVTPEPEPATLENPIAVSSVTDGVNGFDTLKQVSHITTVTIDSSTYALVASIADDGIQVIDITNPATPTAVSSIINGTNGFNTIGGARDITTVTIDSSIYALVASETVDGIQIIDITNPASPTAVSSIIDGDVDGNGNTFGELTGAIGITTVKIGSSTYALVASYYDNGIQIIDITNPASPTVASSITDGVGGFDELDGAFGITTVKIGSSTYALVAASLSNGIPIIDITNPAAPLAVSTVTDGVGGFDKFDEITQITTVKIGQSTYALATSALDDGGVQIIDITNPATPIIVSSITDGDVDGNDNIFDELDGAYGITTIQIGSSTYALVASIIDDGIQIIDITNPATPITVSSITDGDIDGNDNIFDELDGAYGITTVQIGSSTYALVASIIDDGVQIIQLTTLEQMLTITHVGDGREGLISFTDDMTLDTNTPRFIGTSSDVTFLTLDIDGDLVGNSSVVRSDGTWQRDWKHDPLADGTYTLNVKTQNNVNSGTYTFTIDTNNITDTVDVPVITPVVVITNVDVGGEVPIPFTDNMTIDTNTPRFFGTSNGVTSLTLDINRYIAGVSVLILPDGTWYHDWANEPLDDGTYTLHVKTQNNVNSGTYTFTIDTTNIPDTNTIDTTNIPDTNTIDTTNIPDTINPIVVSSIIDGDTDANGNSFNTLDDPRKVATFQINTSTYAIVASNRDHGIQIIDISTPSSPLVVSSITDGSADNNGTIFDTLGGARGINTVEIDGSTYAIILASESVSSTDRVPFRDYGVQIIDISTPSSPLAVSSVRDNVGGFDTLREPSGITTVKINGSTYVLVAAGMDDHGVQIIDISTPAAPTAVSSVTDGDADGNGDIFDELLVAMDITTVKIGAATYALVAASWDDGVQIIDISTPAAPTATSSVTEGGAFEELRGASNITTVQIGAATYALVAAYLDGGVQIIDITNPTTPTAVSSISHGDVDSTGGVFDSLRGVSDIIAIKVGSSTYALVTSYLDGGVQIIDITNPTTPTAVSSIISSISRGASDITTVEIDSSLYALSASWQHDRIQIIRLVESSLEPATHVVSITHVDVDGETVPFTDGMTIDTDTPKFFGTSSDVTFLTLDIDGDLVGNSSVVRSDGTWQRDWKHDPLADGTYTLNVKTQNNVNSGTYTFTIDTNNTVNVPVITPVVVITNVDVGGEVPIPFTDNMTIDTNTPRFFGTSNGVTSLTLDINRDITGISVHILPDGTWQHDWANDPLDDGTYTLHVKTQNNVNSGTYTFTINTINPINIPNTINVPPTPVVSIANVDVDGVTTPFTDGMTLDTDTPKFFGTSSDVTFLTLDIDGDLVGNSSVVRSDGTWQRDWKHDPLADGTYTLNVKTQNNVNSGTYTIIIDTNNTVNVPVITPVVVITNVDVGGEVPIPFTDNMTIDTSTPRFFGTSNDVTSLTLDINRDITGISVHILPDGTWQHDWANDPLDDGTYTLHVKTQNNVNSGTYTFTIDTSPVAKSQAPLVSEPEAPLVSESQAPLVAVPEIAERILSIDDSEPRIQYYPNGAQHRVYDSNGNIEYEYYENGQIKFRYGTNGDSNGIPLEAKWSNGEYRYTYWNYMSLLQWWTTECSVINGERYCGFALTDEERGTPIDAYDINGVRTFGYHPDGQVSKIYNSDGATIEFQYDQNGNQVFP